ncbi:N-glycosylase/DNA lyase [Fulvia fulva]|uniref:DNA-(apurinic or apyrimidinic site) lyase n=1 Tax=Passalora fulva TaxID=5499 RepID=A0A9Q8LCH6_PASFU|nr:N-glycosylase/DNA lyase [Fulvia fulva]KAK4628815.1 N-glycosylase/DNA lyase [Fulvia fulva]KAK4630077.1 N-glycosylase/DNA lyase [Fulvia fulva]UJO14917.1 N-glycosylase/DNA lyase [Fulvia fulva]WPV12843.1 N-glycosylase/DNA lyase [Fulvia fulva]WPV27653.1 N-glycosylase/DNA lyase [Fulvia fulva]
MGALNLAEWQKLPTSLSELCINTTLRCGQSFRWRKNDAGVWSMALHNRILSLYQDPEHLYYRAIRPSQSPLQAPPTPPSSKPPSIPENDKDDDTLDLLKHYFNLNLNSTRLYEQWSASDSNFGKKAPTFTGIRIMNQDAWEALIGFICSSNNNISRISQMVHKLCIHYGPLLGHLDDHDHPYHDFPTPAALAQDGVEAKLRALGFGYRAKYIHQTAQMVHAKGDAWLDSLRNPECPIFGIEAAPAGDWNVSGREGYRAAHSALLDLQGVGPKVADCVCLMGLGWGEAVPVDTHVWQIAQRDYKFGKGKHASLTKATYDAIGDKFRGLWGQEAGWAQSVLFTANLRAFSEQLNAKEEKVEVKEEVTVKLEEGETVVEDVERREKVLQKVVKREREEEERQVLEVEEKVVRSKRRRRN